MAEYQCNVNATSNSGGGTFDAFIEVKAAANTTVLFKRVRVSFPGSAAGAPVDAVAQIKIARNNAAGATGTAGTVTKLRTNAPATTATVNVKNAAAAFTVGTTVDTPVQDAVNTRSVFEWIAADQEEWIETNATGNYLVVAVAVSSASQVVDATATWEE